MLFEEMYDELLSWSQRKIKIAFPDVAPELLSRFMQDNKASFQAFYSGGDAPERIYVGFIEAVGKKKKIFQQLAFSWDKKELVADQIYYFVRTTGSEPVNPDASKSTDILSCLLKKQGDVNTPLVYAPSKVFETTEDGKDKEENSSNNNNSNKAVPLPKRVRWMCDRILKTFYPRLHVDDFEDFLFKEDNGANKNRIVEFLQGNAGERLFIAFDVILVDDKPVVKLSLSSSPDDTKDGCYFVRNHVEGITDGVEVDLKVALDSTLLYGRLRKAGVVYGNSLDEERVRLLAAGAHKSSSNSGFYESLGEWEDFEFAESVSSNANVDKHGYKEGDKVTPFVYIPVGSRTSEGSSRLHIRKIDLDNPNNVTVLDVQLSGENRLKGATCYGSKLADNGILWMCLLDIDAVVGYDVHEKKVVHEFNGICCPNDVCWIGNNSSTLFVAGGSRTGLIPAKHPRYSKRADETLVHSLPLIVPTRGQVYRLDITTGTFSPLFLEKNRLPVIAGIEAHDDCLYMSMLHEVRKLDVAAKAEGFGRLVTNDTESVWEGYFKKEDNWHLANNISRFDSRFLVATLYRQASPEDAGALKGKFKRGQVGTFAYKVIQRTYKYFGYGRWSDLASAEAALVLPPYAPTRVPALVVIDTAHQDRDALSHRCLNMKLDIPEEDLLEGRVLGFFNHNTHVQRHAGKLVFINYNCNRIYVIEDKKLTAFLGNNDSWKI